MRVLVEISQTSSRKSSNSRSSSSNLQFRIIRNFHGDVEKKCRSSVTHISESQRSLREGIAKAISDWKVSSENFPVHFCFFPSSLVYWSNEQAFNLFRTRRIRNARIQQIGVWGSRSKSLIASLAKKNTIAFESHALYTSFMWYSNKLTKHVFDLLVTLRFDGKECNR